MRRINSRLALCLIFLLMTLTPLSNPAQPSSQLTTPSAASAPSADQQPSPQVIFQALCQALRDNYPMLEFVGWRDETWTREFEAKIAAAPTRETAFELMDEFVCRLNDYHTRFSWPGKPRLTSPPFRVEPALAGDTAPPDHGIWGRMRPPLELPALDGIVIAVAEAERNTTLQPGDVIVSVDGLPVREALARAWRHATGCSVGGKLRSASGRMLLGPPESTLKLVVRRRRPDGVENPEQTVSVSIPRTPSPGEKTISLREVDGVPVIRIVRWSNDGNQDLVAQVDQLLDRFRQRPGIIFDVRRNGGGQDDLADKITGRFITAPVIASISFDRQAPDLTFKRRVLTTAPRGPWKYEGRVAVLTDEGCMSACEHFVSGMIEAGALACGTPTSGACGLIRTVNLPAGVKLNVSRTLPVHTGGIPSPQLGIAPHIWAPPTLASLREGQDNALLAALAWIKSRASQPTRQQPVAPFTR